MEDLLKLQESNRQWGTAGTMHGDRDYTIHIAMFYIAQAVEKRPLMPIQDILQEPHIKSIVQQFNQSTIH